MTEDTICCALKLLALHTDIITLLAKRGGGGGGDRSPSVSAERTLNTLETTVTITQELTADPNKQTHRVTARRNAYDGNWESN